METRRQLKERITQLEKQLKWEQHHTRRSALVDKADLPKCESQACYNCKNIVYLAVPTTGEVFLLGCGKNLTCKDFVYVNGKPIWAKEYELLRMGTDWPELELNSFQPPCVVVPRPPCHDEK